jgi:hypothetical protein
VGKSILNVAVNGAVFDKAGGDAWATPSTKNVTVPVGAVDKVLGATVAVKVTASLITTEVPGLAVSVVVVPVAFTRAANAVARLLASTDPSPVAWS